jgi:hypothetical protein
MHLTAVLSSKGGKTILFSRRGRNGIALFDADGVLLPVCAEAAGVVFVPKRGLDIGEQSAEATVTVRSVLPEPQCVKHGDCGDCKDATWEQVDVGRG